MYLSKLVYLSIKNVLYLGDTSFNYDSFRRGDFDNDSDYETNINNVFSPLNEAISRLSDLERIPYIIEKVAITDGTFKFSDLKRDVKQIIGVAKVSNTYIIPIEFAVMGDTVRVLLKSGALYENGDIYVEYKEDIKTFDEDDISFSSLILTVNNDIELKEKYGITESMAQYVIEYVQGKLLEPIAPELANMHITRAETYFSNLQPVKEALRQRVVATSYAMER